MKNILYFFVILFSLSGLSSCGLRSESPEKIFDTIGLNANKISRSFERNFKEIRAHKANGTLQIIGEDHKTMKPATATEYIQFAYAKIFENDIDTLSKLKATDETRPIIDAGLDLFKYADAIYKNDFPLIAKMIDEGKPDADIDAVVAKLENSKGVELDKKYTATMAVLIPFADKHGVKYKTIDMP